MLEQSPAITSSAFVLGDEFDQLCDISSLIQVDPPTFSDDSWMSNGTPTTSKDANMQYFEPLAFGEFNGPTKDAETVFGSGPVAKDVEGCGFGSGAGMPTVQQSTDSFAALFGQAQEFRTGQQGLMPSTGLSPGLLNQNPFSTIGSTQHGRGHDCTTLALRIVTEMHVATQSCSVSDSASMHCLIQGSRGDARDINTVLQVNRDAIRLLNKILDCPSCSADHMCVLACYLAVQKTVAWYAAIVGLDSGVPGHETGLTDLVTTRPIFMGSFALDREAQRLVRTSVILTELRDHVQPLVARLSKHQQPEMGPSSSLPSPSNSSSASGGDLAESHHCVLREQVVRIIARARFVQVR